MASSCACSAWKLPPCASTLNPIQLIPDQIFRRRQQPGPLHLLLAQRSVISPSTLILDLWKIQKASTSVHHLEEGNTLIGPFQYESESASTLLSLPPPGQFGISDADSGVELMPLAPRGQFSSPELQRKVTLWFLNDSLWRTAGCQQQGEALTDHTSARSIPQIRRKNCNFNICLRNHRTEN